MAQRASVENLRRQPSNIGGASKLKLSRWPCATGSRLEVGPRGNHKTKSVMKKKRHIQFAILIAGILAVTGLVWPARSADSKDDAIKEVMKTYHKAPKGVDPVCKKASDGKATPEEIKKLVVAYKSLLTTTPPRGDQASWKDKTAKLYAAAQALEKGAPDGLAKYKVAVNCKACHSVHRPEQK